MHKEYKQANGIDVVANPAKSKMVRMSRQIHQRGFVCAINECASRPE